MQCNALRGRGRGANSRWMDLRLLRESFSSCSRRFPTDLCDLFFVFVVSLFVRGLVVLGHELTSRRHQGDDAGREGKFVLWAAILGPNGYRILGFFRLLRLGCLNQDVSTSCVQNLSPFQHKRLMATDRPTNFIHGIVAARFDHRLCQRHS